MSYRWIDHTAELELHITAPTEPEVFEEALRAIRELMGDQPDGEPVEFDAELAAADRAALLVLWLDELVYRAETEDVVPAGVEHLRLSADGLVARVCGRRGRPRHLVKGVTYNGLEFAGGDDGYHATVVLDV
jgi:SHS2 domain-containing protein